MDTEEPEAYRIGWVPFLGLEIHLDSKPLIPRVETEWWTEQMIEEIKREAAEALSGDAYFSAEKPLGLTPSRCGTSLDDSASFSLLDLCAGSGAIGCALLKHFPAGRPAAGGARVSFGEIDPAHEATIRKNIRANGLDKACTTIAIGDLFAPFAGQQFDYIAANPPYVPEGRELPASVAHYEPALALRAGPDGLALIRRIASEIKKYLAPSGEAWIECDSAHAEEARGLFEAAGLRAEVRLDQYKVPRVVVARRVVSSPA